MTRHLSYAVSVVLVLSIVAGAHAAPSPALDRTESPIAVRSDQNPLVHSTSTTREGLAKAATDTFYLYGGPGNSEGKFELADGRTPDRQGWIGMDRTDLPVYWQVSDFNAANLGGHGAGNKAVWCGLMTDPQSWWVHTPGYGNGWNETLIFESGPLADPSVGQTVNLDLVFNYDTEPDYDFFNVEYDSAGMWVSLFSQSGSSADVNGVFQPPGLAFATAQNGHGLVFTGGDYGGANRDEIVIRIRVSSDGAWSDEDGLWITTGGAAQVDDIHVVWSDGDSFEDFENGFFNTPWRPLKWPFAGDFSQVWPWLRDGDLDQCQENGTPIMAFVDGGQEVGNAASAALIPGYPTSTGGATSLVWSYGVPGNWVVNFDGGLSAGQVRVSNEVWSPPIAWNLPGAADDGPAVAGAKLRFSVWSHLPLSNAIFYVWSVRSTLDGVIWTDWQDRSFVYYDGGNPEWRQNAFDVSDLLLTDPLQVQIAFGVVELVFFGFPVSDATPSPAFDNVAFVKYRIGGPAITTREIDLANDGFPAAGGIDAATSAARDALDIPFDMARDISIGGNPNNDPGDSIIVDVVARIPGTSVTDIRMFWVLDKNPLFEDAIRGVPSRPKDSNVVTSATQWFGEVLRKSSTVGSGSLIADRYFFDLPDANFLYPGDKLRYYIQATDSDGRVSTLPENISGFSAGSRYDRRFTIRGLPSISDAAGTQPRTLVWQDAGRGQEEVTIRNSMHLLALVAGLDYDTYTSQGPSSSVSNGLGSPGAHGASAAQLAGYDTIIYLSGDRNTHILSDGSDLGNNDKSDDIGVLTAWHSLPGIRNVVYFGDGFVSGTATASSSGATYVSDVLRVSLANNDARGEINGQTAPVVLPLNPNFATAFAAFGGCPNIHAFDSIAPRPGAVVGHAFTNSDGSVIPGPAGSVLFDRMEGGDRKVDVVFPYAHADIYHLRSKAAGSTGAHVDVLREVFGFLGVGWGGGIVSAPSTRTVSLTVVPNPFNPRTTVRFDGLAADARGSVRVYDLRGTLVATLHAGRFTKSEFVWNGTDDNGVTVSSGVYFVDARSEKVHRTMKIALVR